MANGDTAAQSRPLVATGEHAGEGYLILATGPVRYVEMARNLAASLRVMDGTRRIWLVHDENYIQNADDALFFDDHSILRDDPLYPGFMNKIRLFDTSPYQRAMFVDADCLLMKRDVDRWWQLARPHPFAITGAPKTRGEWKGVRIEALLNQEHAPYLVQMNSGVFSFDCSPAAQDFFAGLNDFYKRRHTALEVGLHRGKPAQTDEIYLGLWMGLSNLQPITSQIEQASWMVSTWRAFFYQFDPIKGRSTLRKPIRSIAGIPNPIAGWSKLSPSFVHFIGLKPRRHYDRLARYFRSQLKP